jgi:hypothetical protein
MNQKCTPKMQEVQRPPMKKEALQYRNTPQKCKGLRVALWWKKRHHILETHSKMQGAQSSPPMKKEATCLRRGFASHDSGTHPKHYHDVQYYHEKGLHYFSSQRNFMRKRSSRCNKRSVSLSVRHMKINQCVTQHFSLEGDIVNILHEGESGAFDRKLSRHNWKCI